MAGSGLGNLVAGLTCLLGSTGTTDSRSFPSANVALFDGGVGDRRGLLDFDLALTFATGTTAEGSLRAAAPLSSRGDTRTR